MVEKLVKKQIKKEFEKLAEKTGKRIGSGLSKGGDKKGAEIGKKMGVKMVEQMEHIHDAIDKESVTKKDELGIGGKLGTGLGIIGKNLVEKRYGFLGKLAGSSDLISEGRTLGAKTEKITKRAIKTGVKRLSDAVKAASASSKDSTSNKK